MYTKPGRDTRDHPVQYSQPRTSKWKIMWLVQISVNCISFLKELDFILKKRILCFTLSKDTVFIPFDAVFRYLALLSISQKPSVITTYGDCLNHWVTHL